MSDETMRHWMICFFLGITTFPSISAEMSEPGKFSVCQIPLITQTWNKAPRLVEGSNSRINSNAGTTEQPYRLALKECLSNECNNAAFQASIPINIPKNGRYRVAIDQMLWIDTYDQKSKLEGVLCEHSGCAPIRKIVQYDLQAGLHWVTLSGKAASEVGLLVTEVND
ncbi:MAG: hypothetical protein ABTQ26_08510 [Azonexus sp.]